MPLNKKIVLTLVITIFLTISFSGCIFENLFGTSFNISSWSAIDDDGFPAIEYSYSCSDYVYVKMFDSGSELVGSDYYFAGDGEKTLFLGGYKETINPGNYIIKAYDKNGNEISSKSFNVKGLTLVISSCNQKWWVRNTDKILVGLLLNLSNTGDVPVYPYSIILETDDESFNGLVLPSSVLPSDSNTVYCVLYIDGEPSGDSFNLKIYDIDDNFLCSKEFDFNVENSLETVTYTEGVDKKLYLPYPEFLFDYYSNLERISENDYSYYVFDEYDDYFLDIFVDRMISTLSFGEMNYNIKSDPEKINFFADFVQSLEYKEDEIIDNQSEYPNYPIETLFNRIVGCDCEDKSILMASILDHVGFNVSLFRLSNHMAVGVKLGKNDVSGYSYYAEDYYYLETTTEGAPIGFVPSQYRSPSSLEVYKISSRPYIFHTWVDNVFTIYTQTSFGDFVKLDAIIENYGRAAANNIKLKGAFVTFSGTVLEFDEYIINSLNQGKKTKITLSVNIPKSFTTTFKSLVYLDNELVDEKESSSTFP